MNPFRILSLVSIFLLLPECKEQKASPALKDLDWRQYQETICLNIFRGEIVYTACGHGHICGHPTPNCNQAYCSACAESLGVCEVCGKKNNWTKNTDPKTEVPLLLAMLKYSEDLEARRVAIYALGQIKAPKTLERIMVYANDKRVSLQLAKAVGEFKDARYINYLQKVLHNAGNDYFTDESGDTEMQYYIAQAAQTAAASLSAIGNEKAVKVLLNAAKKGRLWERCYAIGAMGSVNDKRSRKVLVECLDEFFARNRDWKWIPGRDLIGATLKSLAQIGDSAAALRVIGYTRNPGCDFLYTDLAQCLSQIGKPVVAEIVAAIRVGLQKGSYDYSNQILLESLGNLCDPRAIPFFVELLKMDYNDAYIAGEMKGLALQGLGKARAAEMINEIAAELNNSIEETTRQCAAQALGQIGGDGAFNVLAERIKKGDTEWVERECFAGLHRIAFDQLKDDSMKLSVAKLYAQKNNFNYVFDLLNSSILDGEAWGKDYFFEILPNVPMRHNFYRVIDLLAAQDQKTFDRTLKFLNKYTKLNVLLKFGDNDDKKTAARNQFYQWYNTHSETMD